MRLVQPSRRGRHVTRARGAIISLCLAAQPKVTTFRPRYTRASKTGDFKALYQAQHKPHAYVDWCLDYELSESSQFSLTSLRAGAQRSPHSLRHRGARVASIARRGEPRIGCRRQHHAASPGDRPHDPMSMSSITGAMLSTSKGHTPRRAAAVVGIELVTQKWRRRSPGQPAADGVPAPLEA